MSRLEDFVVITGFSGAGKSQAMATFEDAGYFCVDNLPPEMIRPLSELFRHEGSKVERAAIVSDSRAGEYLSSLAGVIDELEGAGLAHRVLFLEADEQSLVNRYKETRRRHPLAAYGSVVDGIRAELAPTERAAIFRFRFPADGEASLLFDNVDERGGLPLEPARQTLSGYSDARSGLSNGATRMFVPNSATTEVSLKAGGSDAEYGRFVGGITNVVVKSGTNEYHGEAVAVYRSFRWDANYKDHPELETHPNRPRPRDFFALTPEERDEDKLQGEASLGGPIVRDKAWFFVSAASFSTFTRDRVLEGDLIDQSSKFDSYIGKLNFQAGQSHSISASAIATGWAWRSMKWWHAAS